MTTKYTYQFYGYINYTSSPVSFLTPVFKNEKGEYHIQISIGNNHVQEWGLLPSEYHQSVMPADSGVKIHNAESFIYGFKWNESLFFGSGKELAGYLSKTFLPAAEVGHELAKYFIDDWESLEPVAEVINQDSVWKKCIEFIRSQSKTLPGVFQENFEVTAFENNTLTLTSKNESVKKVFEIQFQEQLTSSFNQEIPGFRITVIQNSEILPPLPFIYFGGEPYFAQGSFIIETRINPFQDFDTFVVGSFNEHAYHRALGFIESKSAPLITIRGEAGVGKTHLVNSIASRFLETDSNKKIGVYTFFSRPDSEKDVPESEIVQLERMASLNDVIIIDDIHNISNKKTAVKRLVRLLKSWKESNKSIVLSFRDTYPLDLSPELLEGSEQLILTKPDEVDKLKILKSKASAYDIHLSGRDILMLSEDKEINNIADIQKFVTRMYLAEDIKPASKNIFFSHQNEDHFNSKWVESSVYDYLHFNMEHAFIAYPKTSAINAKIISHFIQDLFMVSHHGTNIRSEKTYVDGVFYSLDRLQYYLFESKAFKKTISEIIKELILKGNNDEI